MHLVRWNKRLPGSFDFILSWRSEGVQHETGPVTCLWGQEVSDCGKEGGIYSETGQDPVNSKGWRLFLDQQTTSKLD